MIQVSTLQQQMLTVTLTQMVMELKDHVASITTQRNVNYSATFKARGSHSYSEAQSCEKMEMCELLNLRREVIARGKARKGSIFFNDDEEERTEIYKVKICGYFLLQGTTILI